MMRILFVGSSFALFAGLCIAPGCSSSSGSDGQAGHSGLSSSSGSFSGSSSGTSSAMSSSSGSQSSSGTSSSGTSSSGGDGGLTCAAASALAGQDVQACAAQNCCTQLTTCVGDSNCAAVLHCFIPCVNAPKDAGAGDNSQACLTACEGDASASASSEFTTTFNCVNNACSNKDGG